MTRSNKNGAVTTALYGFCSWVQLGLKLHSEVHLLIPFISWGFGATTQDVDNWLNRNCSHWRKDTKSTSRKDNERIYCREMVLVFWTVYDFLWLSVWFHKKLIVICQDSQMLKVPKIMLLSTNFSLANTFFRDIEIVWVCLRCVGLSFGLSIPFSWIKTIFVQLCANQNLAAHTYHFILTNCFTTSMRRMSCLCFFFKHRHFDLSTFSACWDYVTVKMQLKLTC